VPSLWITTVSRKLLGLLPAAGARLFARISQKQELSLVVQTTIAGLVARQMSAIRTSQPGTASPRKFRSCHASTSRVIPNLTCSYLKIPLHG